MATRCVLCTDTSVEPLIEFGDHPIAHGFLDDPGQDEYTHPVTLGFCHACGLSQLVDPIPPERLNTPWMVSAWKPNPHGDRVLDTIEGLPGITKDSPIFEAGSNDGVFQTQLRERGFTKMLGLDPSEYAVDRARERGVETLHAFFTPETAQEVVDSFGRCELFIARQVLEHVADLPAFAAAMRTVLAPGAWVLIEVPDFGFNQAERDYSAFWEEHVNHFTADTMARLLAEAGVAVERVETALFSGQALIVFGRAVGDEAHASLDPGAPERLRAEAHAFRDDWPVFRSAITEYLEGLRRGGKRVAIYGAGCRTSALVNYCDIGSQLECVLDDQPEKQGKYMPGSRLPVAGGEALADGEIDLVLLAVNAENEDKVIAKHREFVERGGEFVSVHPPSERLPEFWQGGLSASAVR